MMRKNVAGLVTLLLFSVSLPVAAETYSWTDENGTVNFTEDRASIPKKYRKKVKQYGDMSSAETIPAPAVKQPVAPSPKDSKTVTDSTALYDGKTFDQWKQELGERETAMSNLRKKIEEVDVEIKKGKSAPATISERNKAVEQYKDLRAQYEQRVEAARKAGITVEMK